MLFRISGWWNKWAIQANLRNEEFAHALLTDPAHNLQYVTAVFAGLELKKHSLPQEEILAHLFSRKRCEMLSRAVGPISKSYLQVIQKLGKTIQKPEVYLSIRELMLDERTNKVLSHWAGLLRPTHVEFLKTDLARYLEPNVLSLLKHRRDQEIIKLRFSSICGVTGKTPKALARSLNTIVHGPRQFESKVSAWSERWYGKAPWPNPPITDQSMMRPISSYTELKSVAKRYNNCAMDMSADIALGRKYLLEWKGPPQALISLERVGKELWNIDQIAGIENVDIDVAVQLKIVRELGKSGIIVEWSHGFWRRRRHHLGNGFL